MKKNLLIIVTAVSILLIAFACSGSKQMASNRPGWVDKGTGYFTGDKDKAFYGVGPASNIVNVALRRKAADAQARAELAAIFKTKIQDLTKIYARSVSGGTGEIRIDEKQFVQSVTKALTELDLSGAIIIDRFYDPVEKTQYSLAVLDMSLFKDKIKEMKELSEEVRDVIEKNAEKAFEELEAESKK